MVKTRAKRHAEGLLWLKRSRTERLMRDAERSWASLDAGLKAHPWGPELRAAARTWDPEGPRKAALDAEELAIAGGAQALARGMLARNHAYDAKVEYEKQKAWEAEQYAKLEHFLKVHMAEGGHRIFLKWANYTRAQKKLKIYASIHVANRVRRMLAKRPRGPEAVPQPRAPAWNSNLQPDFNLRKIRIIQRGARAFIVKAAVARMVQKARTARNRVKRNLKKRTIKSKQAVLRAWRVEARKEIRRRHAAAAYVIQHWYRTRRIVWRAARLQRRRKQFAADMKRAIWACCHECLEALHVDAKAHKIQRAWKCKKSRMLLKRARARREVAEMARRRRDHVAKIKFACGNREHRTLARCHVSWRRLTRLAKMARRVQYAGRRLLARREVAEMARRREQNLKIAMAIGNKEARTRFRCFSNWKVDVKREVAARKLLAMVKAHQARAYLRELARIRREQNAKIALCFGRKELRLRVKFFKHAKESIRRNNNAKIARCVGAKIHRTMKKCFHGFLILWKYRHEREAAQGAADRAHADEADRVATAAYAALRHAAMVYIAGHVAPLLCRAALFKQRRRGAWLRTTERRVVDARKRKTRAWAFSRFKRERAPVPAKKQSIFHQRPKPRVKRQPRKKQAWLGRSDHGLFPENYRKHGRRTVDLRDSSGEQKVYRSKEGLSGAYFATRRHVKRCGTLSWKSNEMTNGELSALSSIAAAVVLEAPWGRGDVLDASKALDTDEPHPHVAFGPTEDDGAHAARATKPRLICLGSEGTPTLDDACCAALGGLAAAGRVSAVSTHGVPIERRGARARALAVSLCRADLVTHRSSNLQDLSLEGGDLGPDALAALLESLLLRCGRGKLAPLSKLALDGSHVGESLLVVKQVAVLLATNGAPATLSLRRCKLQASSARALAQGVHKHNANWLRRGRATFAKNDRGELLRRLESVDLADNPRLGDRGAATLVGAFKHTRSLAHLDMSNTGCAALGADAVADMCAEIFHTDAPKAERPDVDRPMLTVNLRHNLLIDADRIARLADVSSDANYRLALQVDAAGGLFERTQLAMQGLSPLDAKRLTYSRGLPRGGEPAAGPSPDGARSPNGLGKRAEPAFPDPPTTPADGTRLASRQRHDPFFTDYPTTPAGDLLRPLTGVGTARRDDRAASSTMKLSDYVSTYAQKCALPVLFLALGTRMYTQITETMEFELRKSEQPRPGDVLLVGAVAGVADELAVRLATIGNGAEAPPDLETGEARRNFGTDKYAGLESGFWLGESTRRRLAVSSRGGEGSAQPQALAMRFFRSVQPFDERTMSKLEKPGPEWTCPGAVVGGVAQYACLCPNCPAKWASVVYVLADERETLCRASKLAVSAAPTPRAAHAASFLDAPSSVLDVLSVSDGEAAFDRVRAAQNASRHVLVVRASDVRAAPRAVVVAVVGWVLEPLQRDPHRADAHTEMSLPTQAEDTQAKSTKQRGLMEKLNGVVDGFSVKTANVLNYFFPHPSSPDNAAPPENPIYDPGLPTKHAAMVAGQN
ncbi:hypothetical protein JL722_12166 [Aureococcus anophagefferens]|nr:hypothetical protein JL722_12166 [Aureococcus anophagefferens]